MHAIMNWIDWFTDGDRTAARALLVVATGIVLLLAIAWVDSRPDCNAHCQRVADQFIVDNPGLFNSVPTPNPQVIIREVMNNR